MNDNIRGRLVGGLVALGGALVVMSILYFFASYSMGNLGRSYPSVIAMVLVGVILLLTAILLHSKKVTL